jgi:hypothetical protein
METKSQPDKALFFQCLVLFLLVTGILFMIFWVNNLFKEIAHGSPGHILIAVIYLVVFVGFPLRVLSWTLTRFIVRSGEITVIDWFGLRKKIYTLPARNELSIKRESANIRFRFLDFVGKHHEYRTLSFTTKEGKKLKVKSRFYNNFEELNIAIRKACY